MPKTSVKQIKIMEEAKVSVKIQNCGEVSLRSALGGGRVA